MSSDGELHIDDARDYVTEDLNKKFGKDNWTLDKTGYYDLWGASHIPDMMEVNVLDNDEKVIAMVEIHNKFSVEDNYGEKYVEADIDKCIIKDIKQVKTKNGK